jgi:hypothetical protein
MKNYDYWKKSQITDISTFCYWLHQKGVGIYALWHLNFIYGPKVFLLTKIKPEFSNILYNPTHLPGPFVSD